MLTSCSGSELAERSELGTKCGQSTTATPSRTRPATLESHSSTLRRALVMSVPLTTLHDGVACISAEWKEMFLDAWLIGGTSASSPHVTQSIGTLATGQSWGAPSVTAPKPLARPRAPNINVVRIELSPDEAYVDQRSGLLDRKLFIRLARQNAFPASRVGNRYLAKLADVQRYVEAHRLHPPPAAPPADDGPAVDELDDIRRAVGLRPKGTR